MQVLVSISLIILGGMLSIAIKPKTKLAYGVAMAYVILALLLSINVWIFYFSGIKNTAVLHSLSSVMSWGGMLGHIVSGFLVVTIATGRNRSKKIINATLWGISVLMGNSFILATAGKAQHLNEMISFFTISGYATWFLYFIMSAEAFGGLGILLHFKLRTGPLAAAGLAIIMLGAVYTHWHNKDPFSDSYAAVGQFINLLLMLILYYFEQQENHKHAATPIYIV
jgi:putative oxidoreductase